MIDKKKLIQRLTKESKLKEFPLLNLYILVAAILECIGEFFNIYYLRLIKPLPIVLMIIYLYEKSSNRNHLVPKLVIMGLALSLVGDVLLMFDEDDAFIVGTAFFLVAHIVYMIAMGMGEEIRSLSSH